MKKVKITILKTMLNEELGQGIWLLWTEGMSNDESR